MHNPYKMRNVRGALVAVAICTAAAPSSVFAAKPYDAVVEYLDANATSGKTMYINQGESFCPARRRLGWADGGCLRLLLAGNMAVSRILSLAY